MLFQKFLNEMFSKRLPLAYIRKNILVIIMHIQFVTRHRLVSLSSASVDDSSKSSTSPVAPPSFQQDSPSLCLPAALSLSSSRY